MSYSPPIVVSSEQKLPDDPRFNTVTARNVPQRLGEVVLAASTASISFVSIAQSFRRLHLVCSLRGTNASAVVGTQIQFNGDTGANYDFQYLSAAAGVVAGAENYAQTAITTGTCAANTAPASVFDVLEVTIPSYTYAVQKSVLIYSTSKAGVAAGNLVLDHRAGWWRSTAAITQITIAPQAGSFAANSVASLWGYP